MQKRSNYAVAFAPIPLAGDFPFSVSGLFLQRDREITTLHAHDAPELGWCREGNGIFVVGNRVMPFQAGDIVVIMPGETHLAQSVHGTVSQWHWVYFDPARLLYPATGNPALADFSRFHSPGFRNVIGPAAQPELVRLVRAVVEAGLDHQPFRRERLLALLCLFAAELQNAFPGLPPAVPENGGGPAGPRPEQLRRLDAAFHHLNRHYREPLRIGRLAALCHLSPPQFRRLFRQAAGRAPLAYLQQVRIGMAMAELRRGGRSIGDLALTCGFPTLSSFNRQFKQQTGLSPRAWRKETGGNHGEVTRDA
ncbi:MAG: AraC family transcriptional regulator [Lentisphaeria bacterium]